MKRTLAICAFLLTHAVAAQQATGDGWPTYGGDPGGQRYSASAQITRNNVAQLQPAWTYHTHALQAPSDHVRQSDFEATPILVDGTLYLSTPFDRVIALDPATGAERWTYDPALPRNLLAANYTSRGVAAWKSPSPGPNPNPETAPCSTRVFIATLDARLIAVDAATGHLCTTFGNAGTVDLKSGIATLPQAPFRFYGNTSPPTVVGNVVVIGSAIGDNQAVNVEPGTVRGFDAQTGKLLWAWDPMPWASLHNDAQHPRTGGGNAWSVLAADLQRHIVYVPTGAPSTDFYGGLRLGDNRDANSLVALDARTGQKLWAFQLIHHDVWDYDTAAEPLLFDFRATPTGTPIPAVAIAPKTGMLFVLNRLTGQPLFPVEERPVPSTDIPSVDGLSEFLSPTQPFSALGAVNATAIDFAHLNGPACEQQLRALRYDGIFTPPSLRGTLQFPGSLGGVNWGSMSLDPATNTLFVNTNGSAYEIRLIRRPPSFPRRLMYGRNLYFTFASCIFLASIVLAVRRRESRRRKFRWALAGLATACIIAATGQWKEGDDELDPAARSVVTALNKNINSPDATGEISPNDGTPFRVYRRMLRNEAGQPCTQQPWGSTTAINLNTGRHLWQKPLGTLIPGQHTGTVNFGAPIVTAGGLLFTAATSEPLLRAIDQATGEEVWTAPLPVPAQSTPMTYTWQGRQYIVIAAGGHGGLGTPLGDTVIAFALP